MQSGRDDFLGIDVEQIAKRVKTFEDGLLVKFFGRLPRREDFIGQPAESVMRP